MTTTPRATRQPEERNEMNVAGAVSARVPALKTRKSPVLAALIGVLNGRGQPCDLLLVAARPVRR